MRNALMVMGGFVLLAVFMVVGRAFGGALGMSPAAHYFIPVWLLAAIVNLVMALRSGSGFRDEAKVFAIVFAIPAAVALLLAWKLS